MIVLSRFFRCFLLIVISDSLLLLVRFAVTRIVRSTGLDDFLSETCWMNTKILNALIMAFVCMAMAFLSCAKVVPVRVTVILPRSMRMAMPSQNKESNTV
ncbi:hypothetical protein M7I_1778 [Glarea lozoyensis 74030]|uniref:Uncharacterized protein n=1 Tax=Glarea lozoyensis (strain ATCC 74030 / MF5533) TaxID=1104152 RepID=H0EH43_GLAL7|nr:hypothetical protein M7I_1778 [Glarea lozoyensis 74030]